MTIGTLVNKITDTLEGYEAPASILPPFLLKYTAMTRPGLSAYKIAGEIIQMVLIIWLINLLTILLNASLKHLKKMHQYKYLFQCKVY